LRKEKEAEEAALKEKLRLEMEVAIREKLR
jgi:hypothetical protein